VDLSVMCMSRGQGLLVQGIGLLYHRAQHVLYSLQQTGICSPKDLSGKTIAVTEKDAGSLLFPAFLRHVGVNPATVKLIFIPAEEKVPTLLSGKVDALLTYVINGPGVEAGAAEKSCTVHSLVWADQGFDLVSNGFAASQTLLEEKPDLVRRFLRATYRGIVWALSHPAEASDLFSARNPQLEPCLAHLQWERTIPFILTDDARRKGVGFFSFEKVDYSFRVMQKLFNVGKDTPEAVFTNDFLPDIDCRLPV